MVKWQNCWADGLPGAKELVAQGEDAPALFISGIRQFFRQLPFLVATFGEVEAVALVLDEPALFAYKYDGRNFCIHTAEEMMEVAGLQGDWCEVCYCRWSCGRRTLTPLGQMLLEMGDKLEEKLELTGSSVRLMLPGWVDQGMHEVGWLEYMVQVTGYDPETGLHDVLFPDEASPRRMCLRLHSITKVDMPAHKVDAPPTPQLHKRVNTMAASTSRDGAAAAPAKDPQGRTDFSSTKAQKVTGKTEAHEDGTVGSEVAVDKVPAVPSTWWERALSWIGWSSWWQQTPAVASGSPAGSATVSGHPGSALGRRRRSELAALAHPVSAKRPRRAVYKTTEATASNRRAKKVKEPQT